MALAFLAKKQEIRERKGVEKNRALEKINLSRKLEVGANESVFIVDAFEISSMFVCVRGTHVLHTICKCDWDLITTVPLNDATAGGNRSPRIRWPTGSRWCLNATIPTMASLDPSPGQSGASTPPARGSRCRPS